MRSARWIQAGLCAGVLLSGSKVPAQASPQAQTQRAEGDQDFLKQALGVNELEEQLGRLATERASTPEVKAMGQKMVQNHTELEHQLSELARQAGGSGEAE